MKNVLQKCLLGIFCLGGISLAGFTQEKLIVSGFGDSSLLAVEDSAAVTNNGESLLVSGKNPKWNRFLRTRPGVLLQDKTYKVTFSYKRNGTLKYDEFFHLLVRPYSAENAGSDLLQANYVPTTDYKKATLYFQISAGNDYAFQIHSFGCLQGELADFKIVESQEKLTTEIANNPEHYSAPLEGLPVGAKEFDVERPHNKSGLIVNAVDFGVREENPDNIEALNRAIKHCAETGASKLLLKQGVYRMTAPKALDLSGLKDFEFDGGASTFIFYRTKPGIINCRITDCERIVIRNFNMDWDWDIDPIASLVEAVDIGNDYVDFKFYEYERFPRRDVKLAYLSAYDPIAKAVGIEGGLNRTLGMSPSRPSPKSEWLSDNVLRIFISPEGFAKGNLFRLQHYYYNDNDGFHLNNNQHLSMEDINIYSTAGHAVKVDGHQKYWQLLRVKISPPETVKRRPISSTADHCHINRSNGFMKIENCEFSHGADDCLNFHDVSSFVTKKSPRSVQTFRRSLSSLPGAGQIAELRNSDYSPTGIKAPVRELKEINRKEGAWEIVFDCDIPEPIQGEDGFILFDHSYGSRNLIVRNSKFHSNRARGLLLLGHDITVENNQFYHNEMGAIKIETGYTFASWSEGYGASNIVIRNNVFDSVNPVDKKNDNYARDVFIGVYMQTDPSLRRTDYPILRDILFENNTFKESFGLVAFISSAKNVTFRNNKFINVTTRKNPLPYRGAFFITHSSDVRIINNIYFASPYLSGPMVSVATETTENLKAKNILVQGNAVITPH